MKTQALFFDIDGTLVSFRTHRIPQSTVDALTRAKERGVRVFISTGRPTNFINNLGQIEHLVDGFITTNGAYCYIGSTTIALHAIAPSNVKSIISACDQWDCPAIIVGRSHVAVYRHQPIVDQVFGHELGLGHFRFDSLEEALGDACLQITPFITHEQEARLMPSLANCNSGRWCAAFTDITDADADKGKGIEAIAKHEGFDIGETMAFGDGGNDNAMLRRAGTGVAMGNANPETKATADYVTASVDDDGVSKALRHFGIID